MAPGSHPSVLHPSTSNSYRKYDQLAGQHINRLRNLTNKIQDCRLNQDSNAIKKAVMEYDEALEKYIPVLMAQ